MSFTPQWLALREAADHAARSRRVRAAVIRHFEPRESLRIVDLGCGTGSTVRALWRYLPPQQDWVLVDADADLLAVARRELAGWANMAVDDGEAMRTVKRGVTLRFTFRQADLTVEPLPETGDLVTASALLDLVSAAWLARFIKALSAAGTPCLAALIADGRNRWTPPHPADAAVLADFCADMTRDKGFGPALGVAAASEAERAFTVAGFQVFAGNSPWRLTPPHGAALMTELARGTAQAAASASGHLTDEVLTDWLAQHSAAKRAWIGHRDIFAVPPT